MKISRGFALTSFLVGRRRQSWTSPTASTRGRPLVMKYNRQLMQAIMWDRINIAEVVGVQVISLDQAPEGYGEFDAGVPKKFVIDTHKLFSAA